MLCVTLTLHYLNLILFTTYYQLAYHGLPNLFPNHTFILDHNIKNVPSIVLPWLSKDTISLSIEAAL